MLNLSALQDLFINLIVRPQTIVIGIATIVSLLVSMLYKFFIPDINTHDKSLTKKFLAGIANLFREYVFLLVLLTILTLSYKVELINFKNTIFINMLQTIVSIYIANSFIRNFIQSPTQKHIFRFIFFPTLLLFFMDWLPLVTQTLESLSFPLGNITISLNNIIKTCVFGYLVFWVGKIINERGKKLIRSQKGVDSRSKELFSKMYEISVYVILMVLLLKIIGIDLTTVALFGGALGVGIGFGLQSIASNFISGIILLMDRSLTIGDHVEFEDGRQGTVKELNMRCATVTTYEGKDILVPNEKFITNSFVNWTHKDDEQRYSIKLQVAYKTNLHELFALLRTKISEHPQVLSGENVSIEKRPDAEISNFCDSGVEILIEFWMNGVDDGPNRVGADLLLIIWDIFHEHKIEIPFPQREIKILNNVT